MTAVDDSVINVTHGVRRQLAVTLRHRTVHTEDGVSSSLPVRIPFIETAVESL